MMTGENEIRMLFGRSSYDPDWCKFFTERNSVTEFLSVKNLQENVCCPAVPRRCIFVLIGLRPPVIR